MSVPSKASVHPLLDKHRKAILAAILEAWNDWRTSPYFGDWRCKRSRANFVWEQIIGKAHRAFEGAEGVHIIDGQETFKFLVDERVLFRFKKGDDTGLTANVPTQLALAFHNHQQDLFGLPEVQRVEVVYKINKLETEVIDVLVVARDGNAIVWTYSLLDAGEGVVPLPMPAPDDQPSSAPARRLVRARDASETRDRKKQG